VKFTTSHCDVPPASSRPATSTCAAMVLCGRPPTRPLSWAPALALPGHFRASASALSLMTPPLFRHGRARMGQRSGARSPLLDEGLAQAPIHGIHRQVNDSVYLGLAGAIVARLPADIGGSCRIGEHHHSYDAPILLL
jgi:hypothetical protein